VSSAQRGRPRTKARGKLPFAVREYLDQSLELEVVERWFAAEQRDPIRAAAITVEVADASIATQDPAWATDRNATSDQIASLRSMGAERLAVLRRIHQQGKPWPLLAAFEVCSRHCLPIPDWVSTVINKAARQYRDGTVESLDEAIGLARPKRWRKRIAERRAGVAERRGGALDRRHQITERRNGVAERRVQVFRPEADFVTMAEEVRALRSNSVGITYQNLEPIARRHNVSTEKLYDLWRGIDDAEQRSRDRYEAFYRKL
jgi:hypothetical protein